MHYIMTVVYPGAFTDVSVIRPLVERGFSRFIFFDGMPASGYVRHTTSIDEMINEIRENLPGEIVHHIDKNVFTIVHDEYIIEYHYNTLDEDFVMPDDVSALVLRGFIPTDTFLDKVPRGVDIYTDICLYGIHWFKLEKIGEVTKFFNGFLGQIPVDHVWESKQYLNKYGYEYDTEYSDYDYYSDTDTESETS
ncbi:hypothetical protein NY2A_B006L [Paramecium bursaria Chlorella virus NY2A]|uniref:Uncharacterized protein B006L n=2 Tax=Chlorovirus TaxID=181083 RepID=A7IVN1_PBCVN|nr:hypothetical protein NY2A_B006L [Paramecium bursaria Chlorella virus NY2A]YP_009665211.1 hypothetical protein FK949_gp001 [Paramecium bursaria Chlorella virus NYs1]ABT14405.1 hypothetical protein NY2A_B006L [Paramecium bursaria Chlorella virus NY2A]AGE58566.1 hypothetical protein PBCVNYs1_004L [Paramecium bursaria Chlorella virus NYs1]